MNTSNFFKTETGNSYLFDLNQQQILNVHPIIEKIHIFSKDENVKDLITCLREEFPELSVYGRLRFLKTLAQLTS